MMKRNWKKYLSIFLSVCMIVGIIPAIAFAEEDESVVSIIASGTDKITVDEPEETVKPGSTENDILSISVKPQIIERDYSQKIDLMVSNHSDTSVEYYFECDNPNEDLYMNFVEEGSKGSPLVIAPNESQNVALSVFAQNAKKENYEVNVTAYIVGTDRSLSMKVAFGCKAANGGVTLSKGSTSETTLATEYIIKNTGEEKITDISLSLSGDVAEYAHITPSVENLEMNKRASVTVKIVPDLTKLKNDKIDKVSGKLLVSGGATAEEEIVFDVSGKKITSTTMGELALVQDKNPYANMEFDENSFSFTTAANGSEQNFSDITKKYWDESDPAKDGINTEAELKEVVGTLFDKDGMIDFTISDTIKFGDNESMDVSVTVTSELINPVSGKSGEKNKRKKSSDKGNESRTYVDKKENVITETKVYMTLEEYFKYRDEIKGVSKYLDISTKWDDCLVKPESTGGEVAVTVVNKLQGAALHFPDKFIDDSGTYVDFRKISVGKLTEQYDRYNKFANSTFSKTTNILGKGSNYLNTAVDICDIAAVWTNPNEKITSGQRWSYTGLQVARNVNRYVFGKLFSKIGTALGTSIADGPGAVVGYFAGNVLSGLIGFGLDKWLEKMEGDLASMQDGNAVYNDIYGRQCTNAGKIRSSFYLPDYTGMKKPKIYETGRMYDGNQGDSYYVNKDTVNYDYYINDSDKVASSGNSGLTQVTIVDLSDGSEFLKPGKNEIVRDYDTNPGSHYVTADSEITLIYPSDTQISYIGNPEGMEEVRLLADFAVYRENINLKEAPVKGEKNTIVLHIFNRGSQNGWTDVTISDGKNEIGKTENLYMKAFSEQTLEYEWTPAESGEITLSVKLENKGYGMAERKSDNNTASKKFKIRAREIPVIGDISPKEWYLNAQEQVYLTADIEKAADLKEVRFALDDMELKNPKISWEDNKARASVHAGNLSAGEHLIKVTAVYDVGKDSSEVITKEQKLYIKSYKKISFQTDDTISHPGFSLLSTKRQWYTYANISQEDKNWILTENAQIEGQEEDYYIITQCDEGMILTKLDDLNGKTISMKGSDKISIEKEDKITDIKTSIKKIKIGDKEYEVPARTFTHSIIQFSGIDMVSLNIYFQMGNISGNVYAIEKALTESQNIKLSDYYALYQIESDDKEKNLSLKGCKCTLNGEDISLWNSGSAFEKETGILSVLFTGQALKEIALADDFKLIVQSGNDSLHFVDLMGYDKIVHLNEDINHKIRFTASDENIKVSRIRLNVENQSISFGGDSINVPDGNYRLSINYIADGVGTYYEAEVTVSGKDVTVVLPDTKIETKAVKVSWPEKFGDNAILEARIENSGKILEVDEYDIKNGAETSLPTGEGNLLLSIYNSKDRYSQFCFSKSIRISRDEIQNIEVGTEFNGNAQKAYPNGNVKPGGNCRIQLSDLKDQFGNKIDSFYSQDGMLYGKIVLMRESDSQQYAKSFSVDSISSVELSLPDNLPAGVYGYVIYLSTKKFIENGNFYKIKTETEGNGTITPESPLVLEGQDQTFLMAPDEGYRVKNVFVDGTSIGSITSYTFENVSQEHSLKVIFGKSGENSGSNSFIRQTPMPLTTPNPTVSPKPETTPNVLPSDEPIPTAAPTTNSSGISKPTDSPDIDSNTFSKGKMRKGLKITDKKTKAMYKVTSLGKNKTAEYVRSTKKNAVSISVPSVVKLGGKSFKVTSVGKSAFKESKKLKKVRLGNNIKRIGKQAFSGCKKLRSITIGGNVTTIEVNAFSRCAGLTMIMIPSKVKKIGAKAFYQCKNLRYIMIKTKKLTLNNVGKNAFGRGYHSPRVKTDKNVWKQYSAILLQRGISKKALFIINPAKLVI